MNKTQTIHSNLYKYKSILLDSLQKANCMDSKLIETVNSLSKFHHSRHLEALSFVPEDINGYALDIGTKMGYMSYALKSSFDISVIASDIPRPESSYIGKCLNTCGIAYLINNATQNLPFKNDQFNLILFCHVISHLTIHPKKLFQEFFRILKKGGYCILTAYNFARFPNRLRTLAGKNTLPYYFPESGFLSHYRQYTLEELHDFINECQFTILTEKTTNSRLKKSKSYIPYQIIGSILPRARESMLFLFQK